ncbi:sine oculis-binding protein homolog B [Uranotaenia lowii]|uniref:sine oculis-binding protein homolog B n=1 Tax=Uranotaenia lowii TaxID=190385 RepID=UPI002479E55A|nr:sine oculis-binding protein homolog B [Uranotaenia lowii]XP_055592102.1 sine oculis-binding protein homolog B [Uranotaenia lowii]XP_055592103.1 sine oculis-binding protein homolog B [Uranotaenia lowii]
MDLVMSTASSSAKKSTSPHHRIKVKKEICTEPDNIKDFAETAMNDILGWYGYGGSASGGGLGSSENNNNNNNNSSSTDHRIDITPVSSSSSSSLATASAASSSSSAAKPEPSKLAKDSLLKSKQQQHHNLLGTKATLQQGGKAKQFNMLQQHNSGEQQLLVVGVAKSGSGDSVAAAGVVSPASLAKAVVASGSDGGHNNGNNSKTASISGSSSSGIRNGVNLHSNQQQQQQQQQHLHGDSSTSEKDSSRESSKSPLLVKLLDRQEPICAWCRRSIPPNQTGIQGTTEGTIFCSESCFSQSRRASFKRAKTCDWCRHVRHAVSYVDFQDGATQLQFCSDKCLNQYKMQIFCNETQAHLDMNPHLKEKIESGGSLITPELWLKNCKSRSASPPSDRSESVSPAPSSLMRPSPEPSPGMHSPPAKKPMISVAPASKLLSKSLQTTVIRSPMKTNRKRRPGLRPLQTSVHPKRGPANKGEFVQTSNNNNNASVINNNLPISSVMPKPSTVTSGGVQNLRSAIDLKTLPHPLTPTKFESRETSTPRPPHNLPPHFLQFHPNMPSPIRPPFPQMHPAFHFGSPPPQHSMPPPPPLNNPLPKLDNLNRPQQPPFGFPTPPVTVLVPYPIVIPLPLPIPIPIPLIDFLKATAPKPTPETPKVEPTSSDSPASTTDHLPNTTDGRDDISEGDLDPRLEFSEYPLDFTIPSHGNRILQRELEQQQLDSPYKSEEGGPSYSMEPITDDQTNNQEDHPTSDAEPIAEHKLPKFKITRLNAAKRTEHLEALIEELPQQKQRRVEEEEAADAAAAAAAEAAAVAEENRKELVERSRPLRKRKRLVVGHHDEQHQRSAEDRDDGGGSGSANT